MTITIHDKKELKVTGTHISKNNKPVFCITTGEIFASISDAAEANNVHITSISNVVLGKTKTCNGKQFCLVTKLTDHADEIAEAIQYKHSKASKYDAIVAEQERVRKIHENHEKRKAAYLKAFNAFEQAKRLLEESEAEVAKLHN